MQQRHTERELESIKKSKLSNLEFELIHIQNYVDIKNNSLNLIELWLKQAYLEEQSNIERLQIELQQMIRAEFSKIKQKLIE